MADCGAPWLPVYMLESLLSITFLFYPVLLPHFFLALDIPAMNMIGVWAQVGDEVVGPVRTPVSKLSSW